MDTVGTETSEASTPDRARTEAETDLDTRASTSEDACLDGEALMDDYNIVSPSGRSRYGRAIKLRSSISNTVDSPQVHAVSFFYALPKQRSVHVTLPRLCQLHIFFSDQNTCRLCNSILHIYFAVYVLIIYVQFFKKVLFVINVK